jgi:hypothetical protein
MERRDFLKAVPALVVSASQVGEWRPLIRVSPKYACGIEALRNSPSIWWMGEGMPKPVPDWLDGPPTFIVDPEWLRGETSGIEVE